MTARRIPRMVMPLRERRSGNHESSSWPERLLHGLGAHPAFADAVLGDLAEEGVRRKAEGGTVAAGWWYGREAFRSTPHLLWNAVRHGGPRGRARAAAVLAAVALVPIAALIALLLRNGQPASLVIGTGDVDDGFIVNSVRPVQLSMRVFDAAGHALTSTGVRYQWISGAPVSVTPTGVVTCTQPADATVRASLGAVTTSVLLRCRPVRDVRAPGMMNLVVGNPAQDVSFEAVGPDGRTVTLLAGRIAVGDSTIAILEGHRIRARATGNTSLTTYFGDRASFTEVNVYERVRSPEGIRPGQRVAVPVRLAAGEMRRWRLAAARELYYVTMLPDRAEQPMPRFAIVGAHCTPALDAHSFFCIAQHDASVFVYHPQSADPAQRLNGTLAIWRQPQP